jgi:hypothetical protein
MATAATMATSPLISTEDAAAGLLVNVTEHLNDSTGATLNGFSPEFT